MTKNKWFLVSALSAVSVVGIAAAQPGGPSRFEKLDTNADGVVTTAEFETRLLERFTKGDTNQDGKVSLDEIKTQFAAHKQKRFAKRDTNGNGTLERAELAKMPDAFFAKLDADKSGSLSQAELANFRAAGKGPRKGPRGEFRGLPGDTDKDGALTKAEATAGVQKMIKYLDRNSDGKLTQDELVRGRRFGHHGHHKGPRSDAG